MLFASLLLAGCSFHTVRTGLLDVDAAHISLMEQSGRTSKLVADGYGAELYYLDGCGVEVGGPRLGKRMYVRQWKVTDAGDGSAPFVGPLRRIGARWAVEDWTSGSVILLTGGKLTGLAAHAGQTVLIVGFVVGPQEVKVVSWRALSGAGDEPEDE
jgi:hypothetical protein